MLFLTHPQSELYANLFTNSQTFLIILFTNKYAHNTGRHTCKQLPKGLESSRTEHEHEKRRHGFQIDFLFIFGGTRLVVLFT